MDIFLVLIPLAFLLGVAGLVGLLWALRSGQYEDMQGHAVRILKPEDDDK